MICRRCFRLFKKTDKVRTAGRGRERASVHSVISVCVANLKPYKQKGTK